MCIAALMIVGSVAWAKDQQLPELRQCQGALECASRSVVSVLPVWPANVQRSEEPEGSGIVIDDGTLIATADHVIGPAKKIFIRTSSGKIRAAQIVLRDPRTDVALLRIEDAMVPHSLARSIRVAEKACAIGNSFGLDVSITCGVISAVEVSGAGFNQIEDFIQTDAAVNPGMSGGALVNEAGELIGLLSAIFTKGSDSNIGVNFAVSGNLLRRVVEDFLDDGQVGYPSSGILVKSALNAAEAGISGAKIARVIKDSAEEAAGLKVNDIIVFANNRRIKRAGAYEAALALLKEGDSLYVKILRDGEFLDVIVHLE